MAKETREERFQRQIFDQTLEHMIELKQLENTPGIKESEVERWCQSFIKACFGFSSSAGYQVRAQEGSNRHRPDLLICKSETPDKPVVVVEVKRLGANLDRSDFRSGKAQLQAYLENLGDVRWGMLTNGYEWRLYQFTDDCAEVASMDVRGDNGQVDTDKRSNEELTWNILDFSVLYYETEVWPKMASEAQAFSPESLAKATLSADVLKKIAQVIKGEHDLKAPIDVIGDKMKSLLVSGLNDAILNWSEEMEKDLDRHLRAQKRQARKVRKRSSASVTGEAVVETVREGDTGAAHVTESSASSAPAPGDADGSVVVGQDLSDGKKVA